MSRCSWDEYFMNLAYSAASRTTCNAGGVGAVLAKDNRLLTTGYNGSPSKTRHCTDSQWCVNSVSCADSTMPSRAIHAETNALGQAAKYGYSTDGATCYVTVEPCINCVKLLVAAGITRIVYDKPTRSNAAVKMAFIPPYVKFEQYTKSE